MPLKQFVVSIDTVEKQSGFDFLHALDDALERKLEEEIVLQDWF
jgi:endonuclease G, mitochondrial